MLLQVLLVLLLDVRSEGCPAGIDGDGNYVVSADVMRIDDEEFKDCNTTLKSVTISNSVKSIGASSFAGCTALESVMIGNSVKSIGSNAFADCTALKSVDIPDGVTSLGSGVFLRCKNLKMVSIGVGVASVPSYCFDYCSNLTSIDFRSGSQLQTLKSWSIARCTSLESINLPENLTLIGDSAFRENKGLKSVTINGQNLQSLGHNAFRDCFKLLSIVLPDSVTLLGNEVFRGCSSMVSVTLPKRITHIPRKAFYKNTRLNDIILSNKIVSIEAHAFQGCSSLTSINIPDSVMYIRQEAFSHCGLTSVYIPRNVVMVEKAVYWLNPFLQTLEIASLNLAVKDYAFAYNAQLVNVTIDSETIAFLSDPLAESPVQNLRFNIFATAINGLPPAYVKAYICSDGVCGCQAGYENRLPVSSFHFSCTPCQPGTSSKEVTYLGLCRPCSSGKYANSTSNAVCEQCGKGKYGTIHGARSDEVCQRCAPGYYAPATGSSSCITCPSGSECPSYNTSVYKPCSVGTYNSYTGKTDCMACPLGKFGPYEGAAVCEDCPRGKYLNVTGAVDNSSCVDCSAGRYATKNGSSTCDQCPIGMHQSEIGQYICIECTSSGAKHMTNTPDFQGCMALLARTKLLVEILFSGGLKYYVSFSVSAVFAACCGLMQYVRTLNADLGQMTGTQTVLKTALPGLSFGSEIILIIGITSEQPALAIVMILFRVLHIFATLFIILCLFGSKRMEPYLQKVLVDSVNWKTEFNYDFAMARIPFVGMVLILCACDVSIVQMLPWQNTAFYQASHGFPRKSLLRFALGTDMLQAAVSALCSIIYIGNALSKDAKNATTSSGAQLFFALNITMSILTVTLGFTLLFLKDRLLKRSTIARKSRVSGSIVDDADAVVVELSTHRSATSAISSTSGTSDGEAPPPSAGEEQDIESAGPIISINEFEDETGLVPEAEPAAEPEITDIYRQTDDEHHHHENPMNPMHSGVINDLRVEVHSKDALIEAQKEQLAQKDVQIEKLKSELLLADNTLK